MRIAILDDYQSASLGAADWRRLPPDVEVIAFQDHIADEETLIQRLTQFDAVCRIRERTEFSRRILSRLPRLKLLLATGRRNKDSIDLLAATELGITVCSTSSLPVFPVELTWGLILSLARGIHHEFASIQAGGWQSRLGQGLHGKTLGIIGLGTMGVPVAAVGKAFGMNVIAWSRSLTDERAASHGVVRIDKEGLLSSADVVTVHIPLSDASRGLIGEAELSLMKNTAYLINTSRGPIIDESALITALKNNQIAGAGLDTFEIEPLPANHPFRYLQNVLVTPHIGYVTEENYRIYFGQTVENILAYLAGSPIRVLRQQDSL